LGTLVPNLGEPFKAALVEGAVTGGGLTVIANAPNPAGQAILSRFFDGSILPIRLLAGALMPTPGAAPGVRLLYVMAFSDHPVQRIDGTAVSMDESRGTALLIVNGASQCGFTPQYTGLEALHRKYQHRGFAVLGFPCNQFGAQEPGTEAQIAEFCSRSFDV